jgi:hypothetical protein
MKPLNNFSSRLSNRSDFSDGTGRARQQDGLCFSNNAFQQSLIRYAVTESQPFLGTPGRKAYRCIESPTLPFHLFQVAPVNTVAFARVISPWDHPSILSVTHKGMLLRNARRHYQMPVECQPGRSSLPMLPLFQRRWSGPLRDAGRLLLASPLPAPEAVALFAIRKQWALTYP